MFVKFLVAAKGHKIGDIVEFDDVSAKSLITLELAEETKQPAVIDDAVAGAAKGLQDAVTKAVTDAFTAMTKNFTPQTPINRGGLEIADDADIRVDDLVRYGRLKNFPNTPDGIKSAYRFGSWCIGVANSDSRAPAEFKGKTNFAIARCKSMGIPLSWKDFEDRAVIKTGTTKNNASAGFLVPDEFQNVMIDLREKFGVFRQNAKIVPMASDTRSDPRRVGGLTAYFVDEVTAATYSDASWDRVRLVAKKLMALSKVSSELNEDAAISLADDLAGEIAYAFAAKEDDCGWNGDATSTYGGIIGAVQAIKNVSATPTSTIADVLGIWQSAATTWAAITLGDFNTVVSRLPQFADGPEAKWFCHKTFYGSVMQRLQAAAGGNTIDAIAAGSGVKRFLGYDVAITQKLPKSYLANGIPCFLGNLSLAARLGDRRETTIAMSDQFAFDTDALVFRGTERVDIVVHDVGEKTTGTPKDATMGLTAGPIVALMTT